MSPSINHNSVPENLLPSVLEFSLRRQVVDTEVVERYDVRWLSELQVLETDYGLMAIHTKVSIERWRLFWEALSHVNVWEWEASYSNPLVIDDFVESWNLRIQYQGKVLESVGYNSFPGLSDPDSDTNDKFGFFIAALDLLAGKDLLSKNDNEAQ